MDDKRGEMDRGLARERTALAWNRTALSIAAAGAIAIRVGVEAQQLRIFCFLLGAFLLVVAASAWTHGQLSYRRNATAPAPNQSGTRQIALAVVAVATTVTALAALVLAFLPL